VVPDIIIALLYQYATCYSLISKYRNTCTFCNKYQNLQNLKNDFTVEKMKRLDFSNRPRAKGGVNLMTYKLYMHVQ